MAAPNLAEVSKIAAAQQLSDTRSSGRASIRSNKPTAFSILVIDDDADDRRLLRMALKWSRFPVEVCVQMADDCEAALCSLVEGSAPLPSLVLMNLERKGKRCLKALEKLRTSERTRALPVVGWARRGAEPIVGPLDDAYAAHINCMLRKPESVEAAERALSSMINFWTLPNIILPARS